MRNTTLILLFFAAQSSCTAPGDPEGPPDAQRSVLVLVDGEPVSMSGYQTWLADAYGHLARDDYLGMWLLEREARRHNVTVSAQELEAALDSLWAGWVKDLLKGDPAGLDDELKRRGYDRESYRRWFYWQKRRELLASRLIRLERRVDEEMLRRRFEQQYGPKGVHTQVRLLVLTRARLTQELSRNSHERTLTAGELDQRLLEKAEALRERVRAGESFESVVRAESNDLAVRKDGGLCSDEQWRVRGEAFVRAADAAPLHEVQPPVQNSSGVDLFEVVSRQATRLEDEREKLLAAMLAEPPSLDEITALDQRLRAAARIEHP